jgi:hypothetical protein
MRQVALVVLAAAVPALGAAQTRKGAPAKKPTALPATQVSVAGMRVVGPGYGPEDKRIRPFNYDPGVAVVLAVRVPPPFALVSMDKNKSSVAIADSQGRALEGAEIDWNPDFTKDGTAALVELDAKGLPGAGSSHVAVKGTLMFASAGGVKTVKAAAVKLEKGTKVKVGTAILTLGEIEKGSGEGPTVMFESTRPVIKGIKAIRAREPKGGEVEASWSSSGTWTGEDGYQTSYRFKTTATSLNLEFDLWDNLRELPVNFDVQAGLGLGAQ